MFAFLWFNNNTGGYIKLFFFTIILLWSEEDNSISYDHNNANSNLNCFWWWWLKLLKKSSSNRALAVTCFTCDGLCFNDIPCNCQTGKCDGEYCFAERTYKNSNEYFLRKGCARGNIQTSNQCEQQRNKKSVLCYCKHSNFCNNEISSALDSRTLKNVTCNKCLSATDVSGCKSYCNGDYCWVNGGAMDCGYGSLSLQYHLSTSKILYTGSRHVFDQGSACLRYKAGSTYEFQECICNGNNNCNYKNLPDNSLTVVRRATTEQALVTCYTCVESSLEQAIPSASCRSTTCQGQFCVLTIESQTADRNDMMFTRHAGCLNSSRPTLVNKGCNQRWVLKKWEKVDCVCQKDFCNQDVATAGAARFYCRLTNLLPLSATLMITFLISVLFCIWSNT